MVAIGVQVPFAGDLQHRGHGVVDVVATVVRPESVPAHVLLQLVRHGFDDTLRMLGPVEGNGRSRLQRSRYGSSWPIWSTGIWQSYFRLAHRRPWRQPFSDGSRGSGTLPRMHRTLVPSPSDLQRGYGRTPPARESRPTPESRAALSNSRFHPQRATAVSFGRRQDQDLLGHPLEAGPVSTRSVQKQRPDVPSPRDASDASYHPVVAGSHLHIRSDRCRQEDGDIRLLPSRSGNRL